jgi:indole-3-glycerol phosphate synthase
MAAILDTILRATRDLVRARRASVSLHELEQRELFAEPRRGLARALRGERLAVIAECKKASPSAGVIREDYDVASIAQAYARGGADAISVLTEPSFFQGDLGHLDLARRAACVPLLRKDFVVDPFQIVEARAHGADAVLLIATALDRHELTDLMDAADALEMECLVECHAERELDRMDLDRVRILGVNNRNLDTFEVDPGHAARVLARVPASIVRVAESGLRTPDHLAAAWRDGIDAVLVGEALMRADDPGRALALLREGGPPSSAPEA